MSYQVLITERAERELKDATDRIAEHAPETADRWFNGFIKALSTLGLNPQRCGLARENALFPYELRCLLYGRRRSYRAVFTIRDDAVVVLSIRHTARRDLTRDEL